MSTNSFRFDDLPPALTVFLVRGSWLRLAASSYPEATVVQFKSQSESKREQLAPAEGFEFNPDPCAFAKFQDELHREIARAMGCGK